VACKLLLVYFFCFLFTKSNLTFCGYEKSTIYIMCVSLFVCDHWRSKANCEYLSVAVVS